MRVKGNVAGGAALLLLGAVVGRLTRRQTPVATTPIRDTSIGVSDTHWFTMSNEMLVEANLDGYFTRLGSRWETCLGWTLEELMSRPFREFVHPDDLASTVGRTDALVANPGEIVNFENRYRTKDGSWRWLLWSARSDEYRTYAVARDFTDRKLLEQERAELLARVEAMARTDVLTGLPNRRAWDEELTNAIARARRQGSPLALAMVDIDHFKLFNDTHGHVAGDALLASAATAWRRALRVTDFLARYGGEEFAVLLPHCAHGEAKELVERLRVAMPEQQTCSIGVAGWDGAESPDELLTRADVALYEAKRGGRNSVVVA